MGDAGAAEAEACRLEGNQKLSRGDFADAAAEYEKGLVALLTSQEGSWCGVGDMKKITCCLGGGICYFFFGGAQFG